MKKLVIIPAFNEAKNLPSLVKEIYETAPGFDIVVINDCSTDATSTICHEHNIPVIDLPFNLGIGAAVQTGYKYALQHNYDIAIQVDGDGQHDPRFLNKLIQPIVTDGFDCAIGSRFIEKKGYQSSKSRRLGIIYFSALIKLLTGIKICDPTSGFRACNKKTLEEFSKSYPNDYPEPEAIAILAKNKYLVTEVPVIMRNRKHGNSSIDLIKSIYYIVKVTLAILISFSKKAKFDTD